MAFQQSKDVIMHVFSNLATWYSSVYLRRPAKSGAKIILEDQLTDQDAMTKKTNKKKIHHFVHDAYIDSWRTQQRIFAFDLVNKKCFEPTGRNSVGATGKFNNFTFDDTVVALLNYTFERRAHEQESSGIYGLMLNFMNFMKDFEYENKTENFLEDFYEKIETKIGHAMRNVFREELQIISNDSTVFEGLIYFYCIQFMRVPKMRRKLSETMVEIVCGGAILNNQQKDEYIKMHLLISSLAMAMDLLSKGCVIRLRYARYGEKFILSDAPVILATARIEKIEDHKGCVPLNPRLLMEIDNIGIGDSLQIYTDANNKEVEEINYIMVANAERMVYFSSKNQREKYLNSMSLRRS